MQSTTKLLVWLAPFLCIATGVVATSRAEELIRLDDIEVVPEALENWGKRDFYGAVKMKVVPWEDGVLPVQFSKKFEQWQKDKFFEACARWSSVANVRCIEGEYKGRHVTVSKKNGGCWALWGMGRHFGVLRRRMNLDGQCWTSRTLLHELGHAFGLIHEHQRPDRDAYVTIHKKNAKKGFLGLNFKVNYDHQGASYSTPYDFTSIMHYWRKSNSKKGEDTIVPLPQYSKYLDIIGQVSDISVLDGETMAWLYGPPKP